jgi:hypothetical protein
MPDSDDRAFRFTANMLARDIRSKPVGSESVPLHYPRQHGRRHPSRPKTDRVTAELAIGVGGGPKGKANNEESKGEHDDEEVAHTRKKGEPAVEQKPQRSQRCRKASTRHDSAVSR